MKHIKLNHSINNNNSTIRRPSHTVIFSRHQPKPPKSLHRHLKSPSCVAQTHGWLGFSTSLAVHFTSSLFWKFHSNIRTACDIRALEPLFPSYRQLPGMSETCLIRSQQCVKYFREQIVRAIAAFSARCAMQFLVATMAINQPIDKHARNEPQIR